MTIHFVAMGRKPHSATSMICQTALEQQFPTYVVCAWLGNTPTVAHKHYLTVTDDHFKAAAETGDQRGMQTPAADRNTSQDKSATPIVLRDSVRFADVVDIDTFLGSF